jgi:hypothetical protein
VEAAAWLGRKSGCRRQRRAGNGEHSAKKERAQALVPVVKQKPRQEVAAMER